jgi:prohibitin 1
MFNEAIQKHGIAFLEIKKLEAAKEIVENLSKSKNVTFIPGTGAD